MSRTFSPHLFKLAAFKVVAVVLLLSTLTALCAPAAVAFSKDDIEATASSEGLSAAVKSFFTDVLEDAMTRSSAVAQINPSFQSRVSSSNSKEIPQPDSYVRFKGNWSLIQAEEDNTTSEFERRPVMAQWSFDIQSRGP